MESNGAPLWVQELKNFTEFSLGRLEKRLTASIHDLEGRVTRKIENMDVRISGQLRVLTSDNSQMKADIAEIKLRLTAVEHRGRC